MLGAKVLESTTSKYNKNIKVLRTWGMGTYIQVNNLTQSGGIVESIWKGTLKQIKNQNIKSCLILGLGGGTVATLIQKKWRDVQMTGVEIDVKMVKLGEKYLGLRDMEVVISDAGSFKTNKRYDLVIVDLYTGSQFPKQFEKEIFLRSLTKNRLVIFNRLYYKDKKGEAEKFGQKLKEIFSEVSAFKPVANIIFFCK